MLQEGQKVHEGGGHHQLNFTLVNVKMVTLKGTSILYYI